MQEPAAEAILRSLIEALEQLQHDLDKVELWAAALGHFQHPAPEYEPASQFLLPPSPKGAPARQRI